MLQNINSSDLDYFKQFKSFLVENDRLNYIGEKTMNEYNLFTNQTVVVLTNHVLMEKRIVCIEPEANPEIVTMRDFDNIQNKKETEMEYYDQPIQSHE